MEGLRSVEGRMTEIREDRKDDQMVDDVGRWKD